MTEQTWRQAIEDAGRFLAQWGSLAVEFGWTPCDLFDVPRDGAMGLAWWLKGRTATALGPEHAGVGQFPCRRFWSTSKGSCSGFLADDRLCPDRALSIPDPERNDNLTW